MKTTRDVDWRLFTSTVLLTSSASALARDEIDELIASGGVGQHEVAQLRRARPGVAALAEIAEHYEGDR